MIIGSLLDYYCACYWDCFYFYNKLLLNFILHLIILSLLKTQDSDNSVNRKIEEASQLIL